MILRRRPGFSAGFLLVPMLATLLTGCSPEPAAPPAPSSASTTAQDTPAPESEPEPEEFSLMVTGDVLLHPTLLTEAAAAAHAAQGNGQDYDFSPLLAGLKPYVQDADVALCNMETPLGTPPYSGYPLFTVPAQIVADLKSVGYDGCTTASNHSVDAGTPGVLRTLDTFEQAGLFTTGSYRTRAESQAPPILESHGVKLGVIASTYSLNGMSADTDWRVDTGVQAPELITRAKAARAAGAQIVVAAVHDGAEYTSKPTATQRTLGHALADSGEFDFIYMHHTHSVLPIEKYRGTWIVYGLGNSVAKHATPTVLNREGISVKASFTRNPQHDWELSALQWVPHQLSTAPVRWCQVASAQSCVPAADAKASLTRTEQTVGADGAGEDGLREWKLP